MVTTIPSFYRLFFSWVDPIMACPGAAMDFVAPHLFLESLAGPTVPYDSNTIALFHHLGGLYFMVAFLSAVLPRVSADLKVWKALQYVSSSSYTLCTLVHVLLAIPIPVYFLHRMPLLPCGGCYLAASFIRFKCLAQFLPMGDPFTNRVPSLGRAF